MATTAAVGQSFALDGREACIQAIEQARQRILHEAENIVLALVFAAGDYAWEGILSGAAAQLREAKLFGFSTVGQLASDGEHQRSVVVALLAGSDISVQAGWWPGFAHDSQAAVRQMWADLGLDSVAEEDHPAVILVGADGVLGRGEVLCEALSARANLLVAGCLTGSGMRQPAAFQLGGEQGGEGGLAAVRLRGKIKAGVGVAHGWQPVGRYFRVSRAEGYWVRALDEQPASEAYASLFGHPPREWAYPPLNELVRLYPLGLERGDDAPLLVRSPLSVEVDGSFRMNAAVPQGSTGHLLVGSAAACLEAAQEAARQALAALGTARPVLAVVLADVAWKMLFETSPNSKVAAIQQMLGEAVPVAGGYSLGQIQSGEQGVELLNQHVEVIVFGAVD